MTYAIGYVVLGINLAHSTYSNKPDPWKAHRNELYEHVHGREDDSWRYGATDPTEGFGSAYSGGSDAPEWFGIRLGEFDECQEITGEKMIALCTPSQEKMIEYAELLQRTINNEQISLDLRGALTVRKAEVLILWGSS